MSKPLLLVISITLLNACDRGSVKHKNADERLKAYIEKSFEIEDASDREDLEQYLTGEARKRLQAWSDDQFEEAFVTKKRKQPRFKIKEKRPTNDKEINITYELSYLDSGKSHQARVTNKKLCTMVLGKDEDWYVQKCKNLKQLVEYENELSLP